MNAADAVFADRDGTHYLAWFEDLGWLRWPAERGGWARRTATSASAADACDELTPRLAWLALRLSGVPLDE